MADAHFGAASIGDQRARGSAAGNLGKKIDGGGDGKREIDEVGVFQGGSKVTGEGFLDCAAGLCLANDFRAIPTGDLDVGCVFAESESEGAADKACAEDGDSGDEVRSHCGGDS